MSALLSPTPDADGTLTVPNDTTPPDDTAPPDGAARPDGSAGPGRTVGRFKPAVLTALAATLALMVLVTAAAISGRLGPGAPAPGDDAVAAPTDDLVVAVATAPGTDRSARGARDDVTVEACAATGSTWSATGTVANSSDAPRDYRIYVAFVDPAGDTRAVVERNVTDLGAGESRAWRAVATLAEAPAIRCVLRVEQDRPTT